MEQEKNKNGVNLLLIFIIVILAVLCVLFATGTINLKSETAEHNFQQTEILTKNLIDKFIGSYSYKGEYVDKEGNADGSSTVADDALTSGKMATEKLVLNSSGLAEASAGNVRAGGYSAKGKWYISNNELIINNENCTATVIDGKVEYPNCHPVWTYTYKIEDNKVVIISNNNSVATVTLEKE